MASRILSRPTRRQMTERIVVLMQCQADLPNLVLALGAPSRLPCRLNCRQQQRDQDPNHGDHHEQLNQGYPPPTAPCAAAMPGGEGLGGNFTVEEHCN